MSFRSSQSGTVVRKGQMWHGRYYVDVPGQERRRKASVPLGSIHTMKKPQAKRKLRALLEEMGLNSDSHLVRTEAETRTFGLRSRLVEGKQAAHFQAVMSGKDGEPFGKIPLAPVLFSRDHRDRRKAGA